MANSNENTQNPEDNQEKTADKGIQEHSEHTAENKQPESNETAKQEEIEQADTVEQPKEQRKLSDYLEIISKIFGISVIFGTFIGGSFIYNYLRIIGQLSIFPDVVTNTPALIAATLIFGILLYFILFKFLIAFLCGLTYKTEKKIV